MDLPTPYYQDDSCTIYCGDCREILPALGTPELVISDPPYGMDYQSAWRTEWQRKAKIHGDGEFPIWIFDLKPTVAMFLCCRWDNLKNDLPQPKSFIVWDKCRHGMGDLEHEFGRQWEAIAFYPGTGHSFLRRPVDVIRVPCVPARDLKHPNDKPPEMWSPIIASHPGTILDPFMGSGTTLRAAKDLGRRAIGIEINPDYCRIAKDRLRQEVFAL
jgi:site-specific DNA-methyltransferase (adenine-specific)